MGSRKQEGAHPGGCLALAEDGRELRWGLGNRGVLCNLPPGSWYFIPRPLRTSMNRKANPKKTTG